MAEIDMANFYENLPDNSHTGRKEKKDAISSTDGKRVEKVIKGKARVRKNEMRKLADVFISEDVSNVKNYIIMDVIVPAVKKAIYDLVVGTLDISLYGGRGSNSKRPTADKISYDYNGVSRRDNRSFNSTKTNSGYSYDDIILDTRGEAEAVLMRLDEIMEEYPFVRVADLYDLVGITGNYTDNNYGWTNIRNAEVVRVRDGYTVSYTHLTLPTKA